VRQKKKHPPKLGSQTNPSWVQSSHEELSEPHDVSDVPARQLLFPSQHPAHVPSMHAVVPPPLDPQSPWLHVSLDVVQSMHVTPFSPHCVSPVAATQVVPTQHPVQLLPLHDGAAESTPPPESTAPESTWVPPESEVWPPSVDAAPSRLPESGVSYELESP
jgi:hypothetical protein